MIKKILFTALLSISSASYSLTATYESRSDDALTCAGVFYILTSIAEPKGLNDVFSKLTQTMQTIYGSLDFIDSNHSLTYGELAEVKDKESLRLGKLYDIDSEAVVNEYIQCDAWRADIAKQIQENTSSEEVIKNPPVPRNIDNISISNGKREIYRSQLAMAMNNWDALGRITSQDIKKQIKKNLNNSINEKVNDNGQKDYLNAYKFYKGVGVLQDLNKAYSLFLKSAKKGNVNSQSILGNDYLWPDGMNDRDLEKALKWNTKAANQDDAGAQYNLGLHYIYGWGVLKDMSKAKYWIKKAYENGDDFLKGIAKDAWEEDELWKY